MANTLTNLIPTAFASLDVVSRELVGFIPSVTRDARTDRVAKNQTLYSPVTSTLSGALTLGLRLSHATLINMNTNIAIKFLRSKEWTMGNGQCHECYGHKPRNGWWTDTVGHAPTCKLAKSIETLGGKVVWERKNHSKAARTRGLVVANLARCAW